MHAVQFKVRDKVVGCIYRSREGEKESPSKMSEITPARPKISQVESLDEKDVKDVTVGSAPVLFGDVTEEVVRK